MLKFVKILSFVAICLTAAYVGSKIAKAQLPPPTANHECRTFQCENTHYGCSYSGEHSVEGCYVAAASCQKTGGPDTCFGQNSTGNCWTTFDKCLLVAPPPPPPLR